jgi:general secretion pathway protein F
VGLFSRQLGTLLDAGLPLDRSLANITEQTENIYLQKALMEIKAAVVEGTSLSDAMKKHPAIFPPVYYNLVAVGEQTGTYEQSLLRLADLEDANQKMKSKVSTAMFYPMVMIFLLGAILLFLLGVVFPQIQELFVQMDAELPMITKIVIWVSSLLTPVKFIFTSLIVGTLTYLFLDWKKSEKGRPVFEMFLLKQPLIGNFIRKILLARFTRNLGVMLQSRVPLLSALLIVSKIVDHGIFTAEINQAIEKIKEGARFTDAMKKSVIMNQMVLGMISAGELSDSIPVMVSKVADMLENEVDTSIAKLSSLLEPAMMVFMGLMIAVIMAAILMPMYGLTKQMHM